MIDLGALKEDIVERVALATCSSEPCICRNRAQFTGMPCLDRGRAAIEAMREPTDMMGYAGQIYDRMGSPYSIAKDTWRKMIDAALKDPK